jgi:ATP-dependent 26S proteasome regulatory subunit
MINMSPYTANLEHLQAELHHLDLLIEKAIQQFRTARQQNIPNEFQGLYISDDEIDSFRDSSASRAIHPTDPPTQLDSQATQQRQKIQQRIAATKTTTLRLPYLQKTFNLSPFETDILLLALAPEIDLRYQKLYAYLQDDITRKRPSVELALRLFCCNHIEQINARQTFLPTSPLLTHHLIILHQDPLDRPAPLLSHTIKLTDRITEFLLGSDQPDPALTNLIHTITPHHQQLELLPETHRSLQQIATLNTQHQSWFCLLIGSSGTGKKACATAIAHRKKRLLLTLDLTHLLPPETPWQTLISLTFREARLYHSIIYLQNWQQLLTEPTKHQPIINFLEKSIEQHPGLVLAGSDTPWQPHTPQQFIQIELPIPDATTRHTIWRNYLQQNPHTNLAEIQLEYLASSFRFSPGQIQQAIAKATTQAQLDQDSNYTLTTAELLGGCRQTSNHNLTNFARKITPKRTWQDLVLPKDPIEQLQELCQQVRYRTQVFSDWGFDQHLSLGKGVIALFTGDSGTGKTLSAEILAKELGLDLYQVDLSMVVSKYIGETEKNLSRVFTEAQASNAILFFDEADALFGKRSEIKDAHDRYANIEVNYLLQRVETYEGVIILTSNLSNNIDPAFTRRLQFCIEFPFPDEYHRLKIWQNMFPPFAPLATDIDLEFLARKFKIAGGNIKNVVTAAAFRAAAAQQEIGMEHLILSMKREYRKLGKVCEKTEFEQYYQLII